MDLCWALSQSVEKIYKSKGNNGIDRKSQSKSHSANDEESYWDEKYVECY
jgi:hypothetical protein